MSIKNTSDHAITGIAKEINKLLLKLEDKPFIIESYQYSVHGGDRLSAVLLWLSYTVAGGTDYKLILPAMLAAELLHKAALIHDDIIDHDIYREGKAAFHRKYSAEQAIIMGDYLYTLAFTHMNRLRDHFSERTVLTCNDILIRTLSTMCIGEMEDIRYRDMETIDLETCLQMVYTRTATFIESVMEIGAVLGNANDLELNALKHYGKNLGSVFQLVNDLNNILGIEEGYGRVAASEAQKGIKSLPISHFVQQVSSDEKGVFLNRLLSGELHYQDLVESLETKGSLSFTVNIIENCLSEARSSLKQTRRNSGTVILEEIIQHFYNYVQFYVYPLIRQQAETAKAS